MRICVISAFPPTIAGIADYGAHLVQQLARDPAVEAVTVLADQVPGAPPHTRVGRVEVRRVWRRDRAGTGLALLRELQAARADVVWFNLGLTMFGTGAAAAALGLIALLGPSVLGYRLVVTLHELPPLSNFVGLGLRAGPGQFAASLVPRVVLRADRVVVTLDRYRRFLTDRYGARDVVHIAHGAYTEPRWTDEPERETALVFGTFSPHKDPGLVMEAVARLHRRRPAVRLIVAGADHPRFPGFMTECQARHGLVGSWIGYVPADRLGTLFAAATVVVVAPRASTGSSGVIYRALSHGRVVLASDLLDYRGLAQDEDLELAWFEPGDSARLASSLEELLDDPRRRRRMVMHNLQALQRLGPTQTADAYLAAFDGQNGWAMARPDRRCGDLAPALEAGGKG
jgi:glycosyltransferase involved in cell wall biosynthesis